MITELTDAQKDLIDVYRQKWIKIGLNTDAMDFEKAKEALRMCYTNRGLPAPKNIYYATGPMDGYKVYKSIRPDGSHGDYIDNIIYGSQYAAWLSFYDFFQEVCEIDLSNIDGLISYAKEAGWAWVDENDAIIQERPLYIKFDDDQRLHCEDGPAIEYMDGTMVYAWHGVRLERTRWHWISDRSKLTAKEALSQDNLEMRRIACEILGWVHILKELKTKIIDVDDDPMVGTLLEVDIPDVGKENFLRVVCGTGREFAIPVPPTVRTALEANAWTFNIEPEQLRELEVRT